MKISSRVVVIGMAGGLAAAGIGVAGVAAAQGGPDGSGVRAESENGASDPSYVGSVAAPAESGEQSDAEQAQALAGLATITPAQAVTAATDAVAGQAGPAQLENENGYVVYAVEVTAADGTVTEVKVDAATGTVLAQESGDEGAEAGAATDDGEAGQDGEAADTED